MHIARRITLTGLMMVLSGILVPAGLAQSPLFATRRACQSPHGDVPETCKAESPDGARHAQVVQPQPQAQPPQEGHIRIFDAKNNHKLTEIRIPQELNNPIKALAWGPDSRRLAVMYHHDAAGLAPGYVAIVDAKDGALLASPIRWQNKSAQYHFLVWEGTQLWLAKGGGQVEEKIELP
jgi:hypothetical protein